MERMGEVHFHFIKTVETWSIQTRSHRVPVDPVDRFAEGDAVGPRTERRQPVQDGDRVSYRGSSHQVDSGTRHAYKSTAVFDVYDCPRAR